MFVLMTLFVVVVLIILLVNPQLIMPGVAETAPDRIVPGKTYFISIPAGGTSPAALPCQTSNGPKCLPGMYAEFKPDYQSRVYGSPYIAVQFVRQTDPHSHRPLQPGEPVAIFFVQQALWFTGTKLMLSPNQSDALYQPFTRVDAKSAPGYTSPTDPCLLTSDLVCYGTDTVNRAVHATLTNSSLPARIGHYFSAAAEPPSS